MDAVVIHVVGSWLGSQQPVVANILFGKAVSVMAADHRIGPVEIFDHRLQFALVLFGHFLVTLRPKMVVIFLGCPMFRFRSSSRWVSSSTAARRWKMRLSQYST